MSRRTASAVFFAGTGVLALYLFSRFTGGWERFSDLVKLVPPRHWAVVAASAAAFYSLDYARLYCLLRLFGHRLKLWPGIQITCAGFLVADLTPNSELYQPLVVFLLAKQGVPVPVAAAVSLAKSLYMLFWLCTLSFLTLRWSPDVALPPAIAPHLPLYLLPLFLFASFLAGIAFFPGPAHSWCRRHQSDERLPRPVRSAVEVLDRSASALSHLGGSAHPLHWLCHLACIATIAMYGLTGFALCKALQLPISPAKAAAVFSNSLMIAYVAPIPGSIGIAEVATNYLLDPRMSQTGMAASILLRLACWYSIWIPGAVFLLELLRGYGWELLSRLPTAKK